MKLNLIQDNDFQKYMQETAPALKILPVAAWEDRILAILRGDDALSGATLPWVKTHDHLRFRGGEVTLWQGINGHGKSLLLGQAVLGFVLQGEKACIASFEMSPEHTFARIAKQAAMCEEPAESYTKKLIEWSMDKLWIYDHSGSVQPELVFGAIKYSAVELGVKHFVVDNLMKCVKNEEDYTGQKMFVDRVCALARELKIHIHLVHHVRKGQSESDIPGKFDARGSGTIVDQVDHCLTVWRNKSKLEKLRAKPNDPDIMSLPDAVIACDKNRHGSWEGTVNLWFHPASMQYTPDKRCLPIDMMRGVL